MAERNHKGQFLKSDKKRLPRKIKKQIPVGMYCYTFDGRTGVSWSEDHQANVRWWGTKVCPMYFRNKNGHGDCKYLVKTYKHVNGDDDSFDFCLDDQCKGCGFKKDLKHLGIRTYHQKLKDDREHEKWKRKKFNSSK